MTDPDGDELELALFEKRPGPVARALDAGLRTFFVDMEWRGKESRQIDSDTEINRDVAADALALRTLGAPRVWCRIDRFGPWTSGEIREAIEAGVDLIFLPMVEHPREVEAVLRQIDGGVPLGILVETPAAIERVHDLAALPIAAVYVGLNDLAIARGTPLFAALADGTVDRVREAVDERAAFGVAGVTGMGGGRPIPSPLLLAELARVRCDFSFLRRSFRREALETAVDLPAEVAAIQSAWVTLRRRNGAEVERDRAAFLGSLDQAGLR